MTSDRVYSSLIEHIYKAAVEPECWSEILSEMASMMNGTTGYLLVTDYFGPEDPLQYTTPVDEKCVEEYVGHFIHIDERLPFFVNYPGRPLTREMMVRTEDFVKTEIYNDFLTPWGLEQNVTVQMPGLGPSFAFFSIMRPEKSGSFGPAQLKMLDRLEPHVRQSLQIQKHLSRLEQRNLALMAALEVGPSGIVVLDAKARAIFVNDRARRIFGLRDGLRLDGEGRPHAEALADERNLSSEIDAILTAGSGEQRRSGTTLAISRPSMKRPFEVLIAPFEHGRTLFGKRRAAVILAMSDPEESREPSAEHLRRIYGLTPAEARFVATFVEKPSVRAAADRLAITEGAARTYLKRVFEKTGVSSQAALMTLVLSGTATLR